jgi:hypothetical protein
MYVYTLGVHQSLHACIKHGEQSATVMSKVWASYLHLLETADTQAYSRADACVRRQNRREERRAASEYNARRAEVEGSQVGSASALVTLSCVLCTLRTQISPINMQPRFYSVIHNNTNNNNLTDQYAPVFLQSSLLSQIAAMEGAVTSASAKCRSEHDAIKRRRAHLLAAREFYELEAVRIAREIVLM